MVKKEGYQPSKKSDKESEACKNAYNKLTENEQKSLARTFRRFYRLQNFGESSYVELMGKLGMHLTEHLPQKLDMYANQLEIGDTKNKIRKRH